MKTDDKQYRTADKFDRLLGSLIGIPDATKTKPTTCVVHTPLIGAAQTFIVQTFRVREVGDTIFIQYVDDEGSVRIAIPPEVAEAIARQRDALTTKIRKRVGRDQAAARKAQGIQPAFLKKRKGGAA